MKRWWLSLEVIAVGTPLLLALGAGTGEPETFWSNLAVITGSQAATTLVVAVLFASRIKPITQNMGIDASVRIHRFLGSSAVLFIFIHLISIVADYPVNAWLVDLTQAPARAMAGLSAFVVLFLSIIFASKKKQMYERWRWAHRISALVAVAFIVWHIVGLNQLINDPAWLMFFTALLLSTIALPIYRWRRAMRDRRYMVVDISSESETASTITLRPLGGRLDFIAGQFVWVRLTKRPWSEDHPFTIASSEFDHDLRITFRHIGDWTKGHLSRLRPGKSVWIDGPHGSMNLNSIPNDGGIALVAVGVGLTPVMSILRTMSQLKSRQPIKLFISPEENLFLEELTSLDEDMPHMSVHLTVQRPITESTFKGLEYPPAWSFLVCGPPLMVANCTEVLTDLGVPEERILTERFEIV